MKQIVAVLVLVFCSLGNCAITYTIVKGGKSGNGVTTRYWDCCKPSCAWRENIRDPIKTPVKSCQKDGITAADVKVQSGCLDGGSYVCSNQIPSIVNNTFALGFAAASFKGGIDTSYCCSCFLLSFNNLAGKKMIVQVTNTGGDLQNNQFDIAIPGGGVGLFPKGCSSQWGAPYTGWGQQNGGVSNIGQCSTLPKVLQAGCQFRFNFFGAVENPTISFTQVICPSELTKLSGCK